MSAIRGRRMPAVSLVVSPLRAAVTGCAVGPGDDLRVRPDRLGEAVLAQEVGILGDALRRAAGGDPLHVLGRPPAVDDVATIGGEIGADDLDLVVRQAGILPPIVRSAS